MGDTVSQVFSFFDSVNPLGISLTTWIIIAVILGALTLFIRGNK